MIIQALKGLIIMSKCEICEKSVSFGNFKIPGHDSSDECPQSKEMYLLLMVRDTSLLRNVPF